ncbi:MAG TPA: hypothetical protein VGW34_11335 [Allosphingosinicella sp.]|nr:hypothetical protein [Allosphingosinicella sp.]
MSQHEFYRARAEEAKRAAEEATLDNVRERCLRSEAAWAGMADRAARTEKMRAKAEAAKAAAALVAEPVESACPS